jgi:hypothetical protein
MRQNDVPQPVRVVIYVRKSTDEHQMDSITVQTDGARAFIADRFDGRIGATDVFSDEGLSRDEFQKRAGLRRLMKAVGVPLILTDQRGRREARSMTLGGSLTSWT